LTPDGTADKVRVLRMAGGRMPAFDGVIQQGGTRKWHKER
jgi:hypothetical protein